MHTGCATYAGHLYNAVIQLWHTKIYGQLACIPITVPPDYGQVFGWK